MADGNCNHRDIFGECIDRPTPIFRRAIPSSNIFNVPPIEPLPYPDAIDSNDIDNNPENREDKAEKQTAIKTRGFRTPPIKTKQMTAEELVKAKLTRASMINKTEGVVQAQQYLNDNELGMYKIDVEHSNRDAIIVKNEGVSDTDLLDYLNSKDTIADNELMDYLNSDNTITGDTISDNELMDFMNNQASTGDTELLDFMETQTINNEYKIVFAGTDVKNASDLKADAEILYGRKTKDIQQMKDAKAMVENATVRYGVEPTELLGFSLGGSKAISIAQELGIKSTTFNPLIGNEIVGKGKVFGEHNILRTTTDPASLNLARGKNNFNIKNVNLNDVSIDPTDSHSLRHFTEEPVAGGKVGVTDTVISAVHPTNLATGLIASVAGEEFADLIDKGGQEDHAVGHQALAGVSTGFFSGTASAALAGEALTMTALLPEMVAGTVGFSAAMATQSAVANAMQKESYNSNQIGLTSNTTAGAVGGAAASSAGLLTSVGIAAVSGAEVGSLLGPETFGLSILAGVAVGSIIGAGAYEWDHLNMSHTITNQVLAPIGSVTTSFANDVSKDANVVANTLENIGSSVSHGVSSAAHSVSHFFGGH